MTQNQPTTPARGAADSSPAARNLAEWFRQLDRYVRMARTFGPSAPNCLAARERALEDLLAVVGYHAPFVLHCTPLELWLRDEAVVRQPAAGSVESHANLERRVPFLLYRDGIRSLTFGRETTREDAAALLDALARVASTQMTDEDLVTLLWEANLQGLRVDVAPIEQSLRVRAFSDHPLEAPLPGPAGEGLAGLGLADGGTETGRQAGPAGAPGVPFDDWPVPGQGTDALAAWRELAGDEARARDELLGDWAGRLAAPWTAQVPAFVREVLALDPGANTADALGHALVTWLGGAIQHCEWDEAAQALGALRDVDPDGTRTAGALARVLRAVDPEAVAERLDEADPEPQARFFALGVRIGAPALDLLVGVLAIATRVRLRAAATTALSYLCAEHPASLAPYLDDARWHVVRNIVFVLGQIGGPEVVGLLADTARHPDARVRRAVVHALGQSPGERRLPLLVDLLESADAQTVSAALSMLARENDPRVTAALLARVTDAEFHARPDEVKLALVGALGDAAGDEVVPALEAILHKGGWFARRSAERTAAAQALARIGTPVALEVVHAGLESRSEAIRASCHDALVRTGRAA